MDTDSHRWEKAGGFGQFAPGVVPRYNPNSSQIPAVVLSSSNEPEDQARGKELGAEAYRVKAGNMLSVDTLVEQICRKLFPAKA